MTIRKPVAAAVALAAVMTLAACAAESEPVDPSPSGSTGPPAGKVTVWDASAAPSTGPEAYAPVIESFRADYPEIEVEVVAIDPATARQEFEEASRQGTPPTLLVAPSQWTIELAGRGFLEPLTDTPLDLALSDYVPVVRPSVQFDERLWGLPQTATSDALVCNERLLSAAQATVPATWEEVATTAPQVQAAGATLLLAPATGSDALPHLYASGGGMLDVGATSILVNDQASVAGWTNAVALIESGATPRGLPQLPTPTPTTAPTESPGVGSDATAAPSDGEAREAFLQGALACVVIGPQDAVTLYADARAATDVSISINPLPAGTASGASTAGGTNINVAAAAQPAERELGYMFAEHLNSADSQFTLAATAAWPPALGLPIRLLADETTATAIVLTEYAPLLDAAQPWPPVPELASLIPALDVGWAAMAAGQAPPNEAADGIAVEWLTVLPATYQPK